MPTSPKPCRSLKNYRAKNLPKQRPSKGLIFAARREIFFLSLLLFFSSLASNAQPLQGLRLAYGSGPLLRIHPEFPSTEFPARIFEAELLFLAKEGRAWRQLYPNVRIGLDLLYQQLGNKEVLGNSYGIIPCFHFPLLIRPRHRLDFIFGTAISYFDRPYDVAFNPENIAAGSHLNSSSLFKLDYKFSLTPKYFLFTGMVFSHSSNANTRLPNIGNNILGGYLGVGMELGKEEDLFEKKERLEVNEAEGRKFGAGIRMGLGGGSLGAPGGPPNRIYSMAAYAYAIHRQRFRFVLGTKWYFNGNTSAFIRNRDLVEASLPADAWNGVAFIGSEFMFGRLSLVAHLGPYLHQDFISDYRLYTQMGVQYYLRDQQKRSGMQPYIGAFVHAHSGQAEFSEFTLGWVF